MNKEKLKKEKSERAKKRARIKIFGTIERPRLRVSRSNLNIFLQIINDENGTTLVSAHSSEIKGKMSKKEVAFELGKILASKAKEKNIEKVSFDRGGKIYHGRIEAVARGAREGGLIF